MESGALRMGTTTPGRRTGREESALVAAEGVEKKRVEEGGGWQWGCLISAGPSDGSDRAQAPIRQPD